MKLSKTQRMILAKLAHLLFPVEAWVQDKVRLGYIPPKPSSWRATGAKPTVNDLDVVGFIEDLLSHEQDDERVARRWKQVANDPLKYHDALPGRSRWRRSRKDSAGQPLLESKAVFGAAASSNFVLTEERLENGQTRLSPLTRGELYHMSLEALARMTADRGLLHPQIPNSAWVAFLEELKNPTTLTGWPLHIPSSLEFLRQLERDVLYAAWTLRLPVAEEIREVMALETGEYRRPGNAYVRDEVKAAVTKLEQFFGLAPLP
jgi:hypothetical protein